MNQGWWPLYFWCCFFFVVWFCEKKTIINPNYNRGHNLIGSIMVAFIFGWLIWPLCLYRVFKPWKPKGKP